MVNITHILQDYLNGVGEHTLATEVCLSNVGKPLA